MPFFYSNWKWRRRRYWHQTYERWHKKRVHLSKPLTCWWLWRRDTWSGFSWLQKLSLMDVTMIVIVTMVVLLRWFWWWQNTPRSPSEPILPMPSLPSRPFFRLVWPAALLNDTLQPFFWLFCLSQSRRSLLSPLTVPFHEIVMQRPRLSWGQMVFSIKHSHFLSPMTALASKLEVPTNLVLISLFCVPVAWASKSLNWNCFVVPSYPASLLWNPWLAEFLIWKVKPRPGNHFCFFGLALPQIGRWGKTSAVAISQPPPCHNQFQGRLLLMPSLHLEVGLQQLASNQFELHLSCTQDRRRPAGTLSFLSRRGPAPDWWTKCAAAHAGKVTRRLFWPVLQWSYTLSMLQLLHPVFTIYLFLLNLLFLPLSSQSFPPPIFQTHRSPCCSASTDVKPFTENRFGQREMWQFGQMSFSFILKISFSWQSGAERWNQICKCCSSSRLKGGQISNGGQLRGDVKNQLRRSTSLLRIGNQCQNWISVLLSTNNCSQ